MPSLRRYVWDLERTRDWKVNPKDDSDLLSIDGGDQRNEFGCMNDYRRVPDAKGNEVKEKNIAGECANPSLPSC